MRILSQEHKKWSKKCRANTMIRLFGLISLAELHLSEGQQ